MSNISPLNINPLNNVNPTTSATSFAQNIVKPEIKNEFKLLLDGIMDNKTQEKNPLPQVTIQNNPINLNQHVLIAQAATANDPNLTIQDRKKRTKELFDAETKEEEKLEYLNFDHALEITPFQYFSEQAVKSLNSVSQLEFRVNDLMQKYVEGKVSIEEVSIETTKLNLAISFATTVISTASQTFKELISMQI
ncbi:MAG: flagellar hook-basal body complex protein FliE [bacterium]